VIAVELDVSFRFASFLGTHSGSTPELHKRALFILFFFFLSFFFSLQLFHIYSPPLFTVFLYYSHSHGFLSSPLSLILQTIDDNLGAVIR